MYKRDNQELIRVLGVRAGLVGSILTWQRSSTNDPNGVRHILARRSPIAATWSPSPYPIWLRPGTSDITAFKEVLIEGLYDFPLDKTPQTIIDAGANIGLTSIWYSTRYPNARIVAVEAERANYELMVRNLAAFPNVTPLHAALWSHRGVLAVEDAGMGAWAFQTTELDRGVMGAFGTVESLTVTNIIERYRFDHVDLLKVDIEGAEREVFSDPGSLDWIDSVDAVAIELHDRFRPGCSRAFFARVGELTFEATRGDTTFVARQKDAPSKPL